MKASTTVSVGVLLAAAVLPSLATIAMATEGRDFDVSLHGAIVTLGT